MKNPEFKAEYDALEEEFELARELIGARASAKLSPGGSRPAHGDVSIGGRAHGKRPHAAVHSFAGEIRPRRRPQGRDQTVEGGVGGRARQIFERTICNEIRI